MFTDDITPDIPDITDASTFGDDQGDAIIKVVGIGGGGSNAVQYMYDQKIPYVNFVICNTDGQALEKSTVPNKVLIGHEVTKGLGAGNVPDVGKKCAEVSEDKIRGLFTDNTEMVFVTAGMGGGTGTGAAPVVAKIAKEAGMLTIGIVTIPFLFEGERKILTALDGAKKLSEHVDALLVINNQSLIDIYPDYNFFNAFKKADDTLANAARSISEIISEHCYINVDFQDVKTTLKDSGTAIISTAIGEGEHRITDAINKALHSPLLKRHDINSSQRLLLKFVCSKDSENPIRAEEISEITNFTNQLPKTVMVKWGIGDDPSLGDKVKFTVLASGFDLHIIDDDIRPEEGEKDKPFVIKWDSEKDEETRSKEEISKTEKLSEAYGATTIKKHKRNAAKLKYAVLKPEQFDNMEVISMLERVPAINHLGNFSSDLEKLSLGVTPGVNRDSKEEKDPGSITISF